MAGDAPSPSRMLSFSTRAPLRFLPLTGPPGDAYDARGATLPRFDISSMQGSVSGDSLTDASIGPPAALQAQQTSQTGTESQKPSNVAPDSALLPSEARNVRAHSQNSLHSSNLTQQGSGGSQEASTLTYDEGSEASMAHARTLALIGDSKPRVECRKYYERNNFLITQYLYVDRLLASSVRQDLLQDYHDPAPSKSNSSQDEPDEHAIKPTDSGFNAQYLTAPQHVRRSRPKRTAKDIYKPPPTEASPLLPDHEIDHPRDYDLEGGGEDSQAKDDSNGGDSAARTVQWAITVNFAANALLLAGKIAVTLLTDSLSVLASLVDAALDFLSTAIVFITSRLVAHDGRQGPDRHRYPVGRRRLEPLGVLVFSVVMITSFAQVGIECLGRLTGPDHSVVQLGIPSIAIMVGTIIIKGLCWFWCRLVRHSSVQALAQDAMTDVVFNTFSIIFPLVGQFLGLWYLDPLGGLLLSLYVMTTWSLTTARHIAHLTGASATPDAVSVLLYLATRFAAPVRAIQSLSAYHAGDRVNVELDLVLDADMTVRDSHDLGETLQRVIESVAWVERAWVHIDYRDDNPPNHLR